MSSRIKHAITFILVLVLAVSMVPVMTAAPASADPGIPMEGAVTGWTWQWNYVVYPYWEEPWEMPGQPYNTNTRDSIMVVYDDWDIWPEDFWDCHFVVDYTYRQYGRVRTVLNEEVDELDFYKWQGQTLVFLTLSRPMATDATPTVTLVDNDTGAVIDEIGAHDGIAPMLELEVVGDPYSLECFEVIATASEPISEAFIYSIPPGELPKLRNFPPPMPEKDEYGGYCDETFDMFFGWFEADYIDENVAYWEFCLNRPPDPQETFFIEVAAHDYTVCYDEFATLTPTPTPSPTPGPPGGWWQHEKWYVESMFLKGKDTIVIHLWEGWNLISFPREPVDPSLEAVFGDMGVTKVYTFKNYRWYGSAYNIESGTWRNPRGIRSLRSVQPGVGYWVYCSPPGEVPWYIEAINEMASDYINYESWIDVRWNDLMVEVEPTGTAGTVPPTYRLNRGWNLVGVPVLGDLDLMEARAPIGVPPGPMVISHVPLTYVSDFLSGLDWRSMFWYLPPVTAQYKIPGAPGPPWRRNTLTWPGGYLGTTPDSSQTSTWQVGFWLSAFSSLGLPLGMYGEPGVYGSEETYVGEFCCDIFMGPADFEAEFYGITESGDEIYGELIGTLDDFGPMVIETSGEVYGEINHSTPGGPVLEFFWGTTTGWAGGPEAIGGTFTGATAWGRTIEGTYGGVGVFNGCDFEGSMQGTITDVGLLGDVEFDNGIVQDTHPVVMPGYGYWVYLDEAGYLVPVR
jgi:hypothetical protein